MSIVWGGPGGGMEAKITTLKDNLRNLRVELVVAHDAKSLAHGADVRIADLLSRITTSCAELDAPVYGLLTDYVGDRGFGACQQALRGIPVGHPSWRDEVNSVQGCIPETRLIHFWKICEKTLGRSAKGRRRRKVPFSSNTPLSDWRKELRHPTQIKRSSRNVRAYAATEIIKVEAALLLVANCESKRRVDELLPFSNSLATGWMIGGGSYDPRRN